MSAPTDFDRALPSLEEPDTGPFWESTLDEQLIYRRCKKCGQVVFFPRSHCTACTSLDLDVLASRGLGTIYALTVVRRTADRSQRGRLPITLALVDLDEGFRMLTELTGVESAEAQIGMRVTLTWEERQTVRLPLFRPLPPATTDLTNQEGDVQ